MQRIVRVALIRLGIAASVIFPAGASAQTIEPTNTTRQQVRYDFDGIEGTLSLTAYVDEDSTAVVSILLSCSKEDATVSVSFQGIDPIAPDTQDHAPGMLTIGTSVISATQFDRMTSTTTYVAKPEDRILSVVKALYDGVDTGSVIRAAEVETGPKTSGTRYLVRLSGPFKEMAILPSHLSEDVDKSDIRKRLGSFYRLCSIWWSPESRQDRS